MNGPRIDIGSIRREQIVESAVAIIAEQGLQSLSLSEIEKRAGMSRGQLMYYFPTKEAILLAVFDRLVQLMRERHCIEENLERGKLGWWELLQYLLEMLLAHPPVNPEFGCLQHTFLSQIGHREDFRERLATLYEEWRSKMAEELSKELTRRPAVRRVAPRALATLVQAIFHGLVMQSAADPRSFNRDEIMDLCLDVLGTYLWGRPRPRTLSGAFRKKATAAASRPPRSASRSNGKGMNGERATR